MSRLEVFASIILNAVPAFSEVREMAIKLWGEKLCDVNPTFFPRSGDKMIFFAPRARKGGHAHSHEMIELIKAAGYFTPNVFGLVLVKNFLIENPETPLPPYPVYFLGYDSLDSLKTIHGQGHVIPVLVKEEGGVFNYTYLPYSALLEQDEILVAFERK